MIWLYLCLLGAGQAASLRPSASFSFFENIWRQGRIQTEAQPADFAFNFTAWRLLYPAHFNALVTALPESVSRPVDIPSGNHTLTSRWIAAHGVSTDPRQGMILYFHGGAYVFGNLLMYEHMLQYVSRDTNLPVLFVDYRLAPESPVVDIVGDCVASFEWVLQSLNVAPGKVILMGDSAGGGLTMLVLQALRAKRREMPAAGVVLSPWLDLSLSGESYAVNKDIDVMLSDLLISPQASRVAVGSVSVSHHSVSPLFGNFEGLPPLYFAVGQNEILLSDSIRGAHRARTEGVTTILEIAPHMPHIYPLFGDIFPEATDARKQIGYFVQQHLSDEFVGVCSADTTKPFKVAIIGAGFAGLNMAFELKKIGVPFTIFERAKDVGGTWHVTNYPGLACDIPSTLYEYSFAFNLNWTHSNPPGPEISAYLRKVAEDYGILPSIRFQHQVTRAKWREESLTWQVTTLHNGQSTTEAFDAVVSAVGQLNVPRPITDPGVNDFKGFISHSMTINRTLPLTGKRVGIVGTGPSAHQIILAAASEASELAIFQRSAPYIFRVPMGPSGSVSAEQRAAERAGYFDAFEALHLAMTRGTLTWNHLAHEAVNFVKANFQPEDYYKVLPKYPYGCKRIVISGAQGETSNDYFETLKKPHVHVVTSPIEQVLPDGVRTQDGKEIGLDVLVYAHGYETHLFLHNLDVIGENGRDLHKDEWKGVPRAYLGVTVPGFPNFFMLYGPNTNLAHNSVPLMLEAQASYVKELIEHSKCGVKRKISVKRDAFEAFNQEVQTRLHSMVWSDKCDNWYKNKDGIQINNWPGNVREYQRRLKSPQWADYSD